MSRKAPYQHKDGSNCWTKDCQRGNTLNSLAIKTSQEIASKIDKILESPLSTSNPGKDEHHSTIREEIETYIVDSEQQNPFYLPGDPTDPPSLIIMITRDWNLTDTFSLDPLEDPDDFEDEGYDQYEIGKVEFNDKTQRWVAVSDSTEYDDLHEAVQKEQDNANWLEQIYGEDELY